ncbi:MAG: CrcB family protein, partial [Frankiales bacterium]|nr:CrcB family protein [Frankiales bacterium]
GRHRAPAEAGTHAVDPDVPPEPAPLVPLLVLVAAGGALGSIARYAIGVALPYGRSDLPVATLLINVSGALLLGLLVATRPHARWMRPFLGTGVLGGFTTFSTFALETDRLLGRAPAVAAAYVVLSLALGLGAAAAGLRLGRRGR